MSELEERCFKVLDLIGYDLYTKKFKNFINEVESGRFFCPTCNNKITKENISIFAQEYKGRIREYANIVCCKTRNWETVYQEVELCR